ncbi:hypothetical protein BC829DRAFT_421829 [Chytridium lagenaria]|nr:hypothetical protein BC829DRAFT_421829 [Chytridium lagenaria]
MITPPFASRRSRTLVNLENPPSGSGERRQYKAAKNTAHAQWKSTLLDETTRAEEKLRLVLADPTPHSAELHQRKDPTYQKQQDPYFQAQDVDEIWNIGGLAKTKDVINELIRLPLLKPELFSFGAPLEFFFLDLLEQESYAGANFLKRSDVKCPKHWDGIQSENGKGAIVVGATNRPFDLDEAVLRRLPRRMVDLPGIEERKETLEILLREENVLYTATDGHSTSSREKTLIGLAEATKSYSDSDLKNLCIAAALRAIRSQYGSMFSATPAAIPSTPPQSGEVVPLLNEKNELMKQLVEWDKMYGTASGGSNKGTDGWGFAL